MGDAYERQLLRASAVGRAAVTQFVGDRVVSDFRNGHCTVLPKFLPRLCLAAALNKRSFESKITRAKQRIVTVSFTCSMLEKNTHRGTKLSLLAPTHTHIQTGAA